MCFIRRLALLRQISFSCLATSASSLDFLLGRTIIHMLGSLLTIYYLEPQKGILSYLMLEELFIA